MSSTHVLTRASESRIVLEAVARPGSFTALMGLYESNYLRLRWLVPDIESLHRDYVSTATADFPLYLTVKEICRYTTTLHLTYLFDDGGISVADPDLDIRIYHDARLAEAMSCRNCRRHELLKRFDTAHGSELERRWTRNMMLNKWLEYCSDKAHDFRPM